MMSFVRFPASAPTGPFAVWVELAIRTIEGLAVAIILIAVFLFTARFLYSVLVRHGRTSEAFTQYKHGMGKALLVALELLVAADIVQTVVLEFTLSTVAALGLLVLVRTFLSWSLVVEIEGRWPWQPVRDGEKGAEGA
jgi:uncharacterized membrane protein